MSWQQHDPPKLPDEPNAVIGALGFTRYPHLFLELARRFEVPLEFLVVLLYLWDATVGQPQFEAGKWSDRNPQGRIAVRQIPVRNHQRAKWLKALCAAQLFNLLEEVTNQSTVGSLYEYNLQSTIEDWVRFFGMVRLAVWFKGDKDKLGFTSDRFASPMFTPDAIKRWIDKDGNPFGLPGMKEEK